MRKEINEKSRQPTAGARRFATIRRANRYRARARSGPEDPHERRQPDPPHGQTTPTKERTLRARASEPTNYSLSRKISTTDGASHTGQEGGRAPIGAAMVVLVVLAVGAMVGVLLGQSSPAFAQEQNFQTFRESTAPAARAVEATVPTNDADAYPSAAQYQYSTPQHQYSALPGGRLTDTGGIGLVALLIGGAAALTAIGVFWSGADDGSGERRGGN